jgi:hypothetical protein
MSNDRMRGIGRRELLAGATGLALSGALAPERAATAATPAATSGDRLHTYLRLRGGLTDRIVIATTMGRYHGVVDTEMRPLFDFITAAFIRYRPGADGGYESFIVEQTYYTDPDSGEVLKDWRNPYTGETVGVLANTVPPRKSIILPEPKLAAPSLPPGASFESRISGPTRLADEVVMVEEAYASFRVPGQPRPSHYSEVNAFRCTAAELGRPGRLTVRSSYEAVSGWRSWMGLAGKPGHLLAIGLGRIDVGMNDLSPVWLEATRRDHPEFLDDPAKLLAPLWDARG